MKSKEKQTKIIIITTTTTIPRTERTTEIQTCEVRRFSLIYLDTINDSSADKIHLCFSTEQLLFAI